MAESICGRSQSPCTHVTSLKGGNRNGNTKIPVRRNQRSKFTNIMLQEHLTCLPELPENGSDNSGKDCFFGLTLPCTTMWKNLYLSETSTSSRMNAPHAVGSKLNLDATGFMSVLDSYHRFHCETGAGAHFDSTGRQTENCKNNRGDALAPTQYHLRSVHNINANTAKPFASNAARWKFEQYRRYLNEIQQPHEKSELTGKRNNNANHEKVALPSHLGMIQPTSVSVKLHCLYPEQKCECSDGCKSYMLQPENRTFNNDQYLGFSNKTRQPHRISCLTVKPNTNLNCVKEAIPQTHLNQQHDTTLETKPDCSCPKQQSNRCVCSDCCKNCMIQPIVNKKMTSNHDHYRRYLYETQKTHGKIGLAGKRSNSAANHAAEVGPQIHLNKGQDITAKPHRCVCSDRYKNYIPHHIPTEYVTYPDNQYHRYSHKTQQPHKIANLTAKRNNCVEEVILQPHLNKKQSTILEAKTDCPSPGQQSQRCKNCVLQPIITKKINCNHDHYLSYPYETHQSHEIADLAGNNNATNHVEKVVVQSRSKKGQDTDLTARPCPKKPSHKRVCSDNCIKYMLKPFAIKKITCNHDHYRGYSKPHNRVEERVEESHVGKRQVTTIGTKAYCSCDKQQSSRCACPEDYMVEPTVTTKIIHNRNCSNETQGPHKKNLTSKTYKDSNHVEGGDLQSHLAQGRDSTLVKSQCSRSKQQSHSFACSDFCESNISQDNVKCDKNHNRSYHHVAQSPHETASSKGIAGKNSGRVEKEFFQTASATNQGSSFGVKPPYYSSKPKQQNHRCVLEFMDRKNYKPFQYREEGDPKGKYKNRLHAKRQISYIYLSNGYKCPVFTSMGNTEKDVYIGAPYRNHNVVNNLRLPNLPILSSNAMIYSHKNNLITLIISNVLNVIFITLFLNTLVLYGVLSN